MDALSALTLAAAADVEERLVGGSERHAVVTDVLPSSVIDFGSLASAASTQVRFHDVQRVDFAPNQMAVRFTVPRDTELQVGVSFNVFAGFRAGTKFSRSWASPGQPRWGDWSREVFAPADEAAPRGGAFVRRRYEKRFRLSVSSDSETALDLKDFVASHTFWPGAPLSGTLALTVLKVDGPNVTAEIAVTNTAATEPGRAHEPTWFDVRLSLESRSDVQEDLFCPLVRGARVRFQTTNCAVVSSDSRSARLGPVGFAVRHRWRLLEVGGDSRDASSSLQSLHNGLQLSGALDDETARAITWCGANNLAAPIARVGDTFVAARGAWHWRRHQLGFIAVALKQFADGAQSQRSVVLNVPTAGGKTEAFVGLALAIAAWDTGRNPIAIIKYPTRLLSREQLSRIAAYLICFERDVPDDRLRGLGYFAGRDEDNEAATATSTVLPECPICHVPWGAEARPACDPGPFDKPGASSGRILRCPNGHRLRLCIRDEVFPCAPSLRAPPLIVVSTWDKFVAKHAKRDFVSLFGGNSYVSLLVLDEAHLIREESGSLDSHFETAFLQAMHEGSRRWPLVVLSSATLAGIDHQVMHLGLGTNFSVYPPREHVSGYYEATDDIQHVVLAAVPRGRTHSWSMPTAFADYLRSVESDAARDHLRVPMLYFPSYTTMYRVQETIQKELNTTRLNEGRPPLRLETFSRERFDLQGELEVRQRVEQRSVDGVLSTNIASVGINFPDLNGILFYGVPTNVSEFIQALSRVGRVQPALALLILDPYKERDASYFAYLDQFIANPNEILEWVPLNRFARNAIQMTFDSIAANQLTLVLSQRLGGAKLWMANAFRTASPARMPDPQVIAQLNAVYHSDEDTSGAYALAVAQRWQVLAQNFRANRGRGLLGYISNTPGVRSLSNLRVPGARGEIQLDAAAEALRNSGLRSLQDQVLANQANDTSSDEDPRDAS